MKNPAINKLLSFFSAILNLFKFWDSRKIHANTLIVKYLDHYDLDNFEYTFTNKNFNIGFDKKSDIDLFIKDILANKATDGPIENDFGRLTVTCRFKTYSTTLDPEDFERLRGNKNCQKLITKEQMIQSIEDEDEMFDDLSDDFDEGTEIHKDTLNIELKTVRNNKW